jgi:hypothetical protein
MSDKMGDYVQSPVDGFIFVKLAVSSPTTVHARRIWSFHASPICPKEVSGAI